MATEWKMLPVPSGDYEEFKRLVERRQSQRGEAVAPSADVIVSAEAVITAVRAAAYAKHRPWPQSALVRLANDTSPTARRFVEVMDLLADRPGAGNELSTKAVVAETDLTLNEWRDACRKLRPHLERNYPDVPTWEDGKHDGEPMWPLVAISGRSLKVYDELYVGMTDVQAARWKSIR